jgi:hypothetical protein
MKLSKRTPTGREKDQAAIELLDELRQKLYNENPSVARRAAFHLSWLQEDGYEILEEALFSQASRRTKGAACYGLRNMHGRMKKIAADLILKGVQSSNDGTKEVCLTAVKLMERTPQEKKARPDRPKRTGKYPIREMRNKKRRRPVSHTSPPPGRFNTRRRPHR